LILWRARRDSNSRPHGSAQCEPWSILCGYPIPHRLSASTKQPPREISVT